jgi:phospholipid/cholesterol/gamma-HCH transport system ATP-binding protein
MELEYVLAMTDLTGPSPPAIEFDAVSMSFGEKFVFNDVSFKLGRGETLFLLGATGTGKSVLLKLVLSLLKPDSGKILIDGQNIVPLGEDQLALIRKRMGIVFQEGALFDSLSVFENVSYRLHEEGEADETRIEQRVREVLGFVELEEAIDKMPSELSGGMRRRVSIARAIVSQPSIMLYDSPTGGLDPVTSHTINILITKLRDTQHVTSVVVTHLIQTAYILLNYVYSAEKNALVPERTNGGGTQAPATCFMVLRDGGVYFQGHYQELLSSARDPYLRKLLS